MKLVGLKQDLISSILPMEADQEVSWFMETSQQETLSLGQTSGTVTVLNDADIDGT